MRIIFGLILFSGVFSNLNAAIPPTKGHIGAGVFLGEPTGFSGKYWMSESIGIDAGVSYSFDNYFVGWAGALYHFTQGIPQLEEEIGGKFRPYVGAGAGFGYSTKDSRSDKGLFFLRIPLGLEWLTPEVPVGIFIEVDPGIGFVPDTEGVIFGGLGARYYF